MQFIFKASAYLLVLLLAGLWLKPQAAFQQSPLQKSPWNIEQGETDALTQNVNLRQHENGQYNFTGNLLLSNISPKMLHWFYKNQIQQTLLFNSQTMPWFRLTNPNTMVNLAIVSSADKLSNEIGYGTVFDEQTLLKDTQWQTRYKVRSFGDEGMTLDILHAGYTVGSIEYKYRKNKLGTEVNISGTIGINMPIVGQISNFYLFKKVYPSDLLDDWISNIVSSYKHMELLIPALYDQRHKSSYLINS